MPDGFIPLTKLNYINVLSLITGIYFAVCDILNTFYLPTHLIFLIILLFFLPGAHLIKLLGIDLRGIRSHFLPIAMITSLSLATNILASLFFLSLGLGVSIFQPVAVVIILLLATNLKSQFFPHNKSYETPYKVNVHALLAIAIVFVISLWKFVYPTFLAPVPSPYPYHVAWDVFIYQGISNRIVSGKIIGPTADINPTTEELPIPLGFPVLVALILKTLKLNFHEVVWLLKIGSTIPAFIGSVWICAIAERKVGLAYSLVTCFTSFSFSYRSFLDIKFFLPSSFAWALGLGICYIFLRNKFNIRNRIVTCLLLMTAAFSIHLYTTAVVMIILIATYLLSRIVESLYKSQPSLTKMLLFYPLFLFLIILWMHISGFQIIIPGGGLSSAGLDQRIINMFRAINPFVWLIPLAGYLKTLEYGSQTKPGPMFHMCILTLFLYCLPTYAYFRVLYLASVAASILTIELIHDFLQRLKEKNLKSPTRMLSFYLSVMIIIAGIYQLHMPFFRNRVYYVNTPEGKLSTSYSLTEYRSAIFINKELSDLKLLIVSDRGYSVKLCGLTGKETLRTRGTLMERFQSILRSLQNKPFDTLIATQLIELLNKYYDISSYDGILLAFSSRTYAFLQAAGDITFFAPLPAERVDPAIRQNLITSNLLNHVYHDGDVDLFILDLQRVRYLLKLLIL